MYADMVGGHPDGWRGIAIAVLHVSERPGSARVSGGI